MNTEVLQQVVDFTNNLTYYRVKIVDDTWVLTFAENVTVLAHDTKAAEQEKEALVAFLKNKSLLFYELSKQMHLKLFRTGENEFLSSPMSGGWGIVSDIERAVMFESARGILKNVPGSSYRYFVVNNENPLSFGYKHIRDNELPEDIQVQLKQHKQAKLRRFLWIVAFFLCAIWPPSFIVYFSVLAISLFNRYVFSPIVRSILNVFGHKK